MSYNYNPKVLNPNKELIQMESGELQPQFFFGGSQIPVNLGLSQDITYAEADIKPHLNGKNGRGINTTVKERSKIYLPQSKKIRLI